jgi:hypothetical protein
LHRLTGRAFRGWSYMEPKGKDSGSGRSRRILLDASNAEKELGARS